MKFIYFLIMLISYSMMMMKHPLSMGLLLIIQSITIAIFMGIISQSFWFSYILFLIMIGGMLILFMYVISMIYNKLFMQKYFNNLWLKMLLIFTITILMNKWFMINNFDMSYMYMFNNNYEIHLNLIKLYNFPMNLVNLMLMNYLFFMLIVTVKITNFNFGPLRMKL